MKSVSIVDVARSCLSFSQEISCGKCVPCRIGSKRMSEMMERIRNGQGKKGDIEILEKLGNYIKITSACGLGKSTANTILSTIHYFQDEYESYIANKFCPTSHCAAVNEIPNQ